ncbi:MAG: erythromycin biosynthesis sensory transduction protein eryC1 [Nitrospinae bacterium RIFCSPLOWO2_12_FULL_45_22]|nr:MAG: erythromycin biosynthesis sensory transduction protein eryC1 [Nitrospinae bacterium RIFCSPLOWO2_12_FULL_45_22]
MNVPFLDLRAQHHQVYNEIDDRVTDIITNTGFILGKYVDEFETHFAKLQGARYCLGLSSGTAALHVALLALGIGPGDGVIVPVNTFIATAEAVSLTGAMPVFVDCDELYNLDVSRLEDTLRQKVRGNHRLKAVIPVHLYGQPAEMAGIIQLATEYGLKVVEDCCQAHLARYGDKLVGNFGEFGAFSFYPGKNLGAYGEAGALITNQEELYLKAKMIRQHGEINRHRHSVIGHNYRMEAIQGAVLSAKLKYLEEWTKRRQDNARLYRELLDGVEGVRTPGEIENASCVYHLYVIQAEDRDGLQAYLHQKGIGTGLHYPIPLHLQEAYRGLGYREGDFPMAERAAKRVLSLPMFPELSERQIRYVCKKIKEYMADSG